MIVREILMSSLLFLNSNVLSLSTSTRTPNDDTKPLDYELMVKLEKTNGSMNYLFKKDWERELGEPYIDNVVKFNKSGSVILLLIKKFSFLNLLLSAEINKNETPAAHKNLRSEFSSNLLGFIIASAGGNFSTD